MKDFLFSLLVIVPIIALRLTADRRTRDWFTKNASRYPAIAAAQRRDLQGAFSSIGHRRFRDNLPYALMIGLLVLVIGLIIDHFA